MKQDPVLPSVDELNIAQNIPKRMLTAVGGQYSYLGGGFTFAVLVHVIGLIAAVFCMTIPQHTVPSISEIQIEYQEEEARTVPDDISALSDIDDNEVSVSLPITSESLPQTDRLALIPLPKTVVSNKVVLKAQKPTVSSKQQKDSEHHSSYADATGKGQEPSKNHSATTQSIKPLSFKQRCSSPIQQYPVAARRRHEQGIAQIGVHVLPTGAIDQISIVESSGYADLDQAAVQAVKAVKCEAASDQPIIKTVIPVTFTLHKN
ncbi:energy transducer TonB [Commensalibacter oyaizuii]|uniref:Energy transducer TonB n=1 Tax=Commensalibacter oyaizuii TaxID=3043873 RepID=A0ABT6Q2R8_9PROT|nr:energy transducer TonB [Commensalibacter sp. TBRC 16381]MDI2091407.1 energy transducer TonB [Commensalibacter sp. TBRC 16381]